jgi:KaiC/GvpD/RAD55 family RecA-like ATPase
MLRVPTGIQGFDKLVQGGFPEHSIILVVGQAGSGKTIFGLEFIYRGASQFNEKGLYITLEQEKEQLFRQAQQFGWDLAALEQQGMIEIMSARLSDISVGLIGEILSKIKTAGVRRLVIDSITSLNVNAPFHEILLREYSSDNRGSYPPISEDIMTRRYLYSIFEQLRALNIVSLMTSEAFDLKQTQGIISKDTVSEFASDGIVRISMETLGGEFSRSLLVSKMRMTKNDEDLHPLEISPSGLVVHDAN